MGNHEVGRAMGRMAEMALKMKKNQTALSLLDEICEPYRGADAEFDEVTEPDQPLGKLIGEAFSPSTDWTINTEDDADRWYDEVYSKFRSRYEFC
ncbi:hypothetical protein LCGC14_1635330 [marine sediment metagenome]|uniref:Uncharacterized protein n=1 Tax=marine sediment metagenome TaxID=412755 RepID=A0A0F9L0U7_9ZZZZ